MLEINIKQHIREASDLHKRRRTDLVELSRRCEREREIESELVDDDPRPARLYYSTILQLDRYSNNNT